MLDFDFFSPKFIKHVEFLQNIKKLYHHFIEIGDSVFFGTPCILITYHIAMHVSARVSARENLYQPEGPVSARGTRADTCPRADTNSEG